MLYQKNFKTRRSIMFALLIIVIGLLPVRSSSQPLADGKSKFLGVGTGSTIWPDLDTYWNQVTPGNDGKWGSVEPTQGQYNWGNLDKIYNYAVEKGIPFKEHALVWNNQQPSWITSLDSAGQRGAVENWIQLLGERYPDMAFVDVVNEPIRGPAPYRNALGGAGKTGWDWVITAFQWARQYCAPGVKLLLNEYGVLDNSTTTNNYKRIIDTLKARNLIDGIGIQGHYFEFRSDMNATGGTYVWPINTLKANLNILASTGLPIYITEFDIDEPIDSNQLAQYKIYFPIFWDHPAVKGITLWGYVQGDVWDAHPNTYLLFANGTERSAMQWLRSYVVPPPVPVLVSPAASATGVLRNPKLVWRSSESATSYDIQVATDSAFTAAVLELTVDDTTVTSFPLDANTKFYWRVNAANGRDTSEYSVIASFTTGDQVSAVDEREGIPGTFLLAQNFPNPFNPMTRIKYSVPQSGYISLKVYNLMGQAVATLFEGVKQPGNYVAAFDGKGLASGIYLYLLRAGNFAETRKLVLVK